MEVEDLWCHELHKFAGRIFGITLKPLYITPSLHLFKGFFPFQNILFFINFLHAMAAMGYLPK